MKSKTVIGVLVVLGFVALAGGGAWYLLRQREEASCPFSGRGIHRQTRALVTIAGKEYEACCVRCAIVEAQQTGKPLRIRAVADFESGDLLKPDDAWFVEDSTVNFCMRTTPAAQSPTRHEVYMRGFDRCEPSVLAFSNEQQARSFIAQHGGVLRRLGELEQEIKPLGSGVKTP